MKLKAKYIIPQDFEGRVNSVTLRAKGRNKREAEKRLRKLFAERGLPTRPEGSIDLLEVYRYYPGKPVAKPVAKSVDRVPVVAPEPAPAPAKLDTPSPASKRRVAKPKSDASATEAGETTTKPKKKSTKKKTTATEA